MWSPKERLRLRLEGRPLDQDDKQPAFRQKYAFAPNPFLLDTTGSKLALNLHPETLEFLAEIPATKRPRSLRGEMHPSEMIAAHIADRQAHEVETNYLKEKCLELQQITQSQKTRQNAMGGNANTLVRASGDVRDEADLKTQRRDALLKMHRAALIAVDKRSKDLDAATDQLRQASQDLNRRKNQVQAATHQGFKRGDQEGMRRGKQLKIRISPDCNSCD